MGSRTPSKWFAETTARPCSYPGVLVGRRRERQRGVRSPRLDRRGPPERRRGHHAGELHAKAASQRRSQRRSRARGRPVGRSLYRQRRSEPPVRARRAPRGPPAAARGGDAPGRARRASADDRQPELRGGGPPRPRRSARRPSEPLILLITSVPPIVCRPRKRQQQERELQRQHSNRHRGGVLGGRSRGCDESDDYLRARKVQTPAPASAMPTAGIQSGRPPRSFGGSTGETVSGGSGDPRPLASASGPSTHRPPAP